MLAVIMGMETSKRRWQRAGSAGFTLVAAGLLAVVICWPTAVEEVLRSRLAISLIAVWTAGFAFMLHPQLSAGFAQGIREFCKAVRQVAREMRGGDDDDGPHAA